MLKLKLFFLSIIPQVGWKVEQQTNNFHLFILYLFFFFIFWKLEKDCGNKKEWVERVITTRDIAVYVYVWAFVFQTNTYSYIQDIYISYNKRNTRALFVPHHKSTSKSARVNKNVWKVTLLLLLSCQPSNNLYVFILHSGRTLG